jgi:hypothetical protein
MAFKPVEWTKIGGIDDTAAMALLKSAFDNKAKVGESLMAGAKNYHDSMIQNKELALKEQLQAAQIADYEARTKGTGAYARTGGSGGSGGGGGRAGTATGNGTDFNSVFNSLYGTQPTPETVPGGTVQSTVSDASDLKAALARLDSSFNLPHVFNVSPEGVTPEQSQGIGGFSITPQASVQAPSTTPITNAKLDLDTPIAGYLNQAPEQKEDVNQSFLNTVASDRLGIDLRGQDADPRVVRNALALKLTEQQQINSLEPTDFTPQQRMLLQAEYSSVPKWVADQGPAKAMAYALGETRKAIMKERGVDKDTLTPLITRTDQIMEDKEKKAASAIESRNKYLDINSINNDYNSITSQFTGYNPGSNYKSPDAAQQTVLSVRRDLLENPDSPLKRFSRTEVDNALKSAMKASLAEFDITSPDWEEDDIATYTTKSLLGEDAFAKKKTEAEQLRKYLMKLMVP